MTADERLPIRRTESAGEDHRIYKEFENVKTLADIMPSLNEIGETVRKMVREGWDVLVIPTLTTIGENAVSYECVLTREASNARGN